MMRRLAPLFGLLLIVGSGALGASPAVPPSLTSADCSAGVTPAQTEGPYFKAGSPERSSLVTGGTAGTKITLTGWVVTTGCAPVAGAVLDFWQADDAGQYDNSGYTMRGHIVTDSQGRYVIETVVPGLYPGRTRHIHVKVQVPGRPLLTTQLYFPEDAARNRADGIYDAKLLVRWLDAAAKTIARFDFVLG
jgi:protocatechuate 3,4-dioxygenase beta subunit